MMTAEEYVKRFGEYFVRASSLEPEITEVSTFLKIYMDLSTAIADIKDCMISEIEQEWERVKYVYSIREFDNAIITFNQKWNRIDDLLTELTGYSWLANDEILNLWNKCIAES